MRRATERIIKFIHNTAAWPLLPLVLGGLSLLDFFILLLPSDAFLIAAVLGNPTRTMVFCVSMIGGKMAGVGMVHWIAMYLPMDTFYDWVALYHMESVFEKCRHYFEAFGPLSLGVTALTPFPLQFVSVLSSASGAALWKMMVWLILGQALRYLILCGGILGGKKILEWSRRIGLGIF